MTGWAIRSAPRIALVAASAAWGGCQVGPDSPQADGATGRAAAPAAAPAASQTPPEQWGLGSHAVDSFVVAWDRDVRPDGVGLPPGRGTAREGAALFQDLCASCHGPEGEGMGINPALVGRGTAEERFRARSIGEFWPYSTTLYDYIRRSMPQTAPGSLQPDQIYSLVAWLLAENDRIGPDDVVDASSLPAVPMPGRERFVQDDRTGGPQVR
ncbi:MAG: cytochrome c [Gemmatimonadota bacterium]